MNDRQERCVSIRDLNSNWNEIPPGFIEKLDLFKLYTYEDKDKSGEHLYSISVADDIQETEQRLDEYSHKDAHLTEQEIQFLSKVSEMCAQDDCSYFRFV